VNTEEVVDARKTRIDEEQAWAMLKTARAVTVAKGKKVQKLNPVEDGKEAVLQQAMGPSGNLRAPTYRVNDEYIIGFNAELYEAWVK
jgi:hypothetical protein